jgi:hypothetical protein
LFCVLDFHKDGQKYKFIVFESDKTSAYLKARANLCININANLLDLALSLVSNRLAQALGKAGAGQCYTISCANRLEWLFQALVLAVFIAVPFRWAEFTWRNINLLTLAKVLDASMKASSKAFVGVSDAFVGANGLPVQAATALDARSAATALEDLPELSWRASLGLGWALLVEAASEVALLALPYVDEARRALGNNDNLIASVLELVVSVSWRAIPFDADALLSKLLVTLGTIDGLLDTLALDVDPSSFLRALMFTDAAVGTLLDPSRRASEFLDDFLLENASITNLLESRRASSVDDDLKEDDTKAGFIVNTNPARRASASHFNGLQAFVFRNLFVILGAAVIAVDDVLLVNGDRYIGNLGLPDNLWLVDNGCSAVVAAFLNGSLNGVSENLSFFCFYESSKEY